MVHLKQMGDRELLPWLHEESGERVWDKKRILVLFCRGKEEERGSRAFFCLAASFFFWVYSHRFIWPPPKAKGKLSLSFLWVPSWGLLSVSTVWLMVLLSSQGPDPGQAWEVFRSEDWLWLARAVSDARFDELCFGYRREMEDDNLVKSRF